MLPSVVRNFSVTVRYVSRQSHGQSLSSCRKRGKFTVVMFMGSPDFLGFVSVKSIPSGCFRRNLMSSSHKTDDLSGDTKASNINNFFVKSLRARILFSPSDERYVVTLDTSHVVEYLGLGGLSFAIPLIKRVTSGCWPTGFPSIHGCIEDIAERRTLTVRYCRLQSNWSLRNVKMSLIVAEIGLIFLRSHQLCHFVHAQSYVLFVDRRVAEAKRRVAVFGRPAVEQSCWK